jgi:cholesterol oxidase
MLRASVPTELPLAPVGLPRARPIGLRWEEALDGYVISAAQARTSVLAAFQKKSHVDEAHFAALERKARATGDRVVAKLTATIRDVDDFLLQQTPRIAIHGSIVFAGRDHPVKGNLHLHLRSAGHAPSRAWSESGQQRLHAMTYLLRNGSGLELLGRKVIRDDPGFDMWSDLSTLYVTVSENGSTWVGVVRVQLADFVEKQLRQLQVLSSEDGGAGGGDIDDVAKAWALMKFGRFFLGSVKNVYSNW